LVDSRVYAFVVLATPVPALRLLGLHRGLFSGESSAPPAGETIINNDNTTLVYVDAPHRSETPEQWEARQRRRLEALGQKIPSSE
jgi:hypothetical protein